MRRISGSPRFRPLSSSTAVDRLVEVVAAGLSAEGDHRAAVRRLIDLRGRIIIEQANGALCGPDALMTAGSPPERAGSPPAAGAVR
jgi:hypothetical protein